MSVKLENLPAQKFTGEVTSTKLQSHHEALLVDTQRIVEAVNKASVVDLGELDVDITETEILARYSDTQAMRFTRNGTLYSAQIYNGELQCVPFTRVSDL